MTILLDPARFQQLRLLARAAKRSPRSYAEAALSRDIDAFDNASRVITMYVPHDAADLTPGLLVRTEGESDERYAERSALMDALFAIPDAG